MIVVKGKVLPCEHISKISWYHWVDNFMLKTMTMLEKERFGGEQVWTEKVGALTWGIISNEENLVRSA